MHRDTVIELLSQVCEQKMVDRDLGEPGTMMKYPEQTTLVDLIVIEETTHSLKLVLAVLAHPLTHISSHIVVILVWLLLALVEAVEESQAFLILVLNCMNILEIQLVVGSKIHHIVCLGGWVLLVV